MVLKVCLFLHWELQSALHCQDIMDYIIAKNLYIRKFGQSILIGSQIKYSDLQRKREEKEEDNQGEQEYENID